MEFGFFKSYTGELILCLQGYGDDKSCVNTTPSMYWWLSGVFGKSQNYYYVYINEIVYNHNGKLNRHPREYFNLDNVKDIKGLLDQLNGFLVMEKLISTR